MFGNRARGLNRNIVVTFDVFGLGLLRDLFVLGLFERRIGTGRLDLNGWRRRWRWRWRWRCGVIFVVIGVAGLAEAFKSGRRLSLARVVPAALAGRSVRRCPLRPCESDAVTTTGGGGSRSGPQGEPPGGDPPSGGGWTPAAAPVRLTHRRPQPQPTDQERCQERAEHADQRPMRRRKRLTLPAGAASSKVAPCCPLPG